MIGFELDFSVMALRYIGAGITQFYFNGEIIITPGLFIGMQNEAEFYAGTIPLSEGDPFYFLTDGFTDRLNQLEYAGFWSPDGKYFDADVAAEEQMAEQGDLHDDATGICLKIKASWEIPRGQEQ